MMLQLSREALWIRRIYSVARGRHDSLRSGVRHVYVPPRRYDGCPAVLTESGMVLEKRVDSVWEILADWFHENRIDPLSYIFWQFSTPAFNRIAPEPRQLLTDERRRQWAKASRDMLATVQANLDAENEVFASRIAYLKGSHKKNLLDAVLGALNDLTLEITPLYRYCRAAALPNDAGRPLVKIFMRPAVEQYMPQAKVIDRVWSRLLPAGFRATAKSMFEKMLENEDPDGSEED